MNYTISLAGVPLALPLEREEAARYFSRFAAEGDGLRVAPIPEEVWDFWRSLGKPVDAFGEYSVLSLTVSDALLPQQRCVLHGAAFSYLGKAWAICANPGVGKTTILRQLMQLAPEVAVISGDRPIVALDEDAVRLHPSPWNGKENMYGAPAAPLGGLIFLRRAEENKIEPLSPARAVFPLLPSLVCSYETEALIRQYAAFMDKLLSRVPAVALLDRDAPEAAAALLQYLNEVSQS